MPPFPASFATWIERLPTWRGLRQLSPERPYAHAEEAYDDQYGVTEAEPEEGQGLCALLKTHGVDTSGPALEIGCGTGRLTYGLARNYPGPDFLITDPSEKFLRLAQSHVGDAGVGSPRLHFAVLNADDLGLLPPAMFSLIAMRSTLHHILQVKEFIAACARTLRPGGAVAMGAEPNESGYVLMAAVGQSIVPVLQAAGVKVRPEWIQQVQDFTEAVRFYCRRDLDKTNAEDKHLFREHELSDLGAEHGLRLRYFPNASFSDYAPPYQPDFVSFTIFFLNYLQFCMMFDAEFLDLIRIHLQPQLKFIDDCHPNHVGPAITGVFLLQKAVT